MAQVTAVGHFSSLSIRGKHQASGNITWTIPTLPSGATVKSTTLTGTTDGYVTLGSIACTINGVSCGADSSFSLNLGTALKSSVPVTAKGSNSWGIGSLSISNIVYTVVYDSPPVIAVGIPDKTRISDEAGHDTCICTFTADQDLSAWEARATRDGVTPARGVGLLVESGGSLAAGEAGTVLVQDEELTGGDGLYTITVYGCGTNGLWSK